MKALVFGVEHEPYEVPADANPLLRGLSRTPVRLMEVPDARPLHPDWVVTRPRLTGICGSDSKQILLDFGEGDADNAMSAFCSFPQVMGHEVVADVVELGPKARGLEVGQRVVLNPWLSCGPRGIEPQCPACVAGDYSLCWNFTTGDISAGIHTGVSGDVTGGYAELMPAHDSMLFPVPDSVPDETAVFADPFAVSLHSVTRHPPPPGGKVVVYGAGSLGCAAVAMLRALYPDVEVAVIARFEAQAALARKLGAHKVLDHEPRLALSRSWRPGPAACCTRRWAVCPWPTPGASTSSTTRSASPRPSRSGCGSSRPGAPWSKAASTRSGRWEWSPLYFKEISWVGSNAFGIEEVEGVRRHGIAHYLNLVEQDRVDLTGMLTHTFTLDQWRDAFATIATQGETGAIKVAIDLRG